ncbi:MAG: CDP-alcohol phosphatidyltransferase family protein [Flavobacteriales bacterium]|nr:CDP-alcohol phosphatidyltransferase family protein [Flavobacteriales bacterium]HPF89594.1 CDP-alcohol phosphatidyltransferase family protein [Flavobacteriales bacterium]
MARLPRIPDLLTTANLACGVASILLASQGQLTWACWLVFAGALFDVFDGLAARALGGGTPLGAQLDSLADMVTFGVAPGMLVGMSFLHNSISPDDTVEFAFYAMANKSALHLVSILLTVLIIPIASAWRLAKFNIDTRQSTGFLGLATPANAMFWASVCLVFHPGWRLLPYPQKLVSMVLAGPPITLTVSILLAACMLSSIPLPSLKFKHMGWKGNEVIYLLLGIGTVLVVLYGVLAVPLILVIYLLSPLWGRLFPKTA